MKNDGTLIAVDGQDDSPVAPVVAGQEIRPTQPAPVAAKPAVPEPVPVPQAEARPDAETELDLATLNGSAVSEEPAAAPPAVAVPPAPASDPAPTPEPAPPAQPEPLPGAPSDIPPASLSSRRRPVIMRRSKRSRAAYAAVVVIFLALGAGVCYWLYQHYEAQADTLRKANSQLTTQTQQLERQATTQADKNAGKTGASKADDMKSTTISLADGKVMIPMPKEWTKVPVSGCAAGSAASKAICQGIVTITPNGLLQADGTAKWSAKVAVYGYAAADGDARNWYETKYDGASLASYKNPKPTGVDTAVIGDNSALQFLMVGGAAAKPTYTDGYYSVVHGSYAAVVTARLQDAGTPGQAAYDYRTTYGPVLQALLKAVEFKD